MVYANVNQNQNRYVNNSSKDASPYLQDKINTFASANVNDRKGYTNNTQLETNRFFTT